jgi:hypothetical protein
MTRACRALPWAHGGHQRNLKPPVLGSRDQRREDSSACVAARATTDAAIRSFPIEMAWMRLPPLFAAVNRARLPRELTYRGSTRLKHHRGSFRLPSAVPQTRYFCGCSINVFCSIYPSCEHACLQKVYSPLPPASRYQWRPLQLHHCASYQTAYLCAHSEPRRNRSVRL